MNQRRAVFTAAQRAYAAAVSAVHSEVAVYAFVLKVLPTIVGTSQLLPVSKWR
jgi:hypothetical protein